MITLAVKNLQKSIGKKEIIKDISFEVHSGEVFGFLGPNGAGKTTTIRMIVGLIKPSAGSISICGYNVQEDFIEAMKCVGSIVENPELYKFLSGRENLELFSRMLGPINQDRIAEVVQLVELSQRIDDKVSTYSRGMRQRLGIAQALLGKPKLLVLDEPTNGLDPAGIKEMRGFLRKLAHEENLSVFVSSHLLGEIQLLCDQVAIISHGRIIKTDSVKEIISTEIGTVEWDIQPLNDGLKEIKGVSLNTEILDERRILSNMPFLKISEVNQALVAKGIKVNGIKKQNKSLEDLFLELTGGDKIE